MSFHYEFPSPFYLLIFQVSDMRYKAVRTENTHLKGMMGDLDPGRYMVICWIHSLNWARDYLIGQDFPKHCLLSTCHISGMQELQTILHSVEFTFILRLEHLISSFLPSSVSWIELNSDHLPDTFFRCFQSCCCLEILPHTWYILQLTQILCFSFPLFNVTVDGWFFFPFIVVLVGDTCWHLHWFLGCIKYIWYVYTIFATTASYPLSPTPSPPTGASPMTVVMYWIIETSALFIFYLVWEKILK
jgi:hypothetical protein